MFDWINWVNVDLKTAMDHFADGEEIKCEIGDLRWTFKLDKRNGIVELNQKMIKEGQWYVQY